MPSTDWRLGLRTIYIVPSRFGVLWLASAVLLVLVAIQTGSNSTLLLAFLLLGVMALAMVQTHDNLDGVTLRCATPVPGFAQEVQLYPVLVVCPTPRQQVQLRFEGQRPEGSFCCPAGERRLDLRWTPDRRGRQLPPRLLLDSVAPLGLFICWTRWRPPVPQLIWPARRPGPVQTSDPRPLQSGLEEWQDLRPLRRGDRQALVDWAGAAKGRPLQAKQFSDPAERHHLLSPASGLPLEAALEHLAERIWQLHHQGASYGLKLPGCSIAPARGVRHRDACLELLALA